MSSDMSTQEKFDFAVVEVKRLKNADQSEKLQLYALFKQGQGEDFKAVEEPKGMFAFEAKAKYAAWEKVKDLSVEDAQTQYFELFEELKEKYGLNEKEEPKK